MIENDRWILDHADELGIQRGNVNPASVDLCLGGHIIEKDVNGFAQEFHLAEGESFTFRPGGFYIAHSEEYTRCPTTHAWMLFLKSSTGRKGLDHLHAGWGDPGFEGQVTFEFTALQPVTFQRGQRIVQLVYLRLTAPPSASYGETGHYQGQRGATEARV